MPSSEGGQLSVTDEKLQEMLKALRESYEGGDKMFDFTVSAANQAEWLAV